MRRMRRIACGLEAAEMHAVSLTVPIDLGLPDLPALVRELRG